MRRLTIGRLIALLMGATVAGLLTIDTAMACRFLMRRHYSYACSPPVSYSVSASTGCYPAASGPVVYGPSSSDCCYGAPVETVSGYGGSSSYGGYVVEGVPVDQGVVAPTPASPTPAPPTPPVAPPSQAGSEVPRGSAPATPPSDAGRGVAPANVQEPTDAAPMPPTEDLPSDDLPADEDLFSEPPADTTDEDLFSEPPSTEPPTAQPPTPPADAPEDDLDLFDQPADDASPADAAEDGVDDLFGPADGATEPALPSDPPAPGIEEPLPSDTPAEETEDSLDDLFGEFGGAADEPRTASADAGVNDLFGGADAETSDAGEVNDLFGEPATSPAAAPANPAQPPVESLEAPDAQPNNNVDDLDDLFSVRPLPGQRPVPAATQPVAKEVTELPMRQWTDNTGHYHTVGRLVKVTHTHVRLLKDNQRFTTVPKHRLSDADLAYVHEVTRQLGVETFDQVAQK